MLQFTDINIDDRDLLEPFLLSDSSIQSDRCFSSLFIWSEHYKLKKCIKDDCLFLRAEDGDKLVYYMPLGGSIESAVREIEFDAANMGREYYIALITEDKKTEFEALGKYEIYEERDDFDYVYEADKLIALSGKKYHAKRNFVNRFLSEHQGTWSYEDVCPMRHREEILSFMSEWCEHREENEDYIYEYSAIVRALDNWRALKMLGGLIRINGELVAFTMATKQSDDVMDILIEKADSDCVGAYPMINNTFASLHCKDCKYINREEDLGIEGLRSSKMSYHPAFLTQKYIALPKMDV